MWVPSVPPILQKIHETVAGLKHAVKYWRGVGPIVRTGKKESEQNHAEVTVVVVAPGGGPLCLLEQ